MDHRGRIEGRGFARLAACVAVFALGGSPVMAAEAAITTYGTRNPQAPEQLDLFAFLVGKWQGAGKANDAGGNPAHFEVSWIGRYVLDGTAIADEFHGTTPDGKPYLGISLRQYDARAGAWIVEYLNVTASFLRRQVNARSGSVTREGDSVLVVAQDGEQRIRERFTPLGRDRFTYVTELSRDGGRSWDPPVFEMTLMRAE
jgi:hypothetical protein